MKTQIKLSKIIAGLAACGGLMAVGCGEPPAPPAAAAPSGLAPKQVADMLHAVMAADRTVYAKKVINRLVKEHKVIKASEYYEDEKALPLPAQMFRMGAELVTERDIGFTYGLLSEWPINKQHAPKTDIEKQGLEFIKSNGGTAPFYGEETLGDQKYFSALYADIGVAAACVDCHNDHKDSPKTDFKLGDVMGGVMIRIPLGKDS